MKTVDTLYMTKQDTGSVFVLFPEWLSNSLIIPLLPLRGLQRLRDPIAKCLMVSSLVGITQKRCGSREDDASDVRRMSHLLYVFQQLRPERWVLNGYLVNGNYSDILLKSGQEDLVTAASRGWSLEERLWWMARLWNMIQEGIAFLVFSGKIQ